MVDINDVITLPAPAPPPIWGPVFKKPYGEYTTLRQNKPMDFILAKYYQQVPVL
jgi:hypothetical protein